MDLGLIQEYVLPHWPFIMMAFVLGGMGVVAKRSVWTKEAAAQSRFMWHMRSLLPLHAPVAGAMIAAFCETVLGEMPVSPGVSGLAGVMLYHMGAGAASSHLYGAIRYLMKAHGIVEKPVSMPPPPPKR